MFQFQTGAIKRKEGTRRLVAYHVFQFQTGAIKSQKRVKSQRNSLKGFNSKLVRLKAQNEDVLAKTQERFNSKLVRLKVEQIILYTDFEDVSIPNWCD